MRGDSVTVWAPRPTRVIDTGEVTVRPLRPNLGFRARWQLAREVDALPPEARLLVQYSPHAYGHKGMNLPLSLLVARRRGRPVDVMFHEVAFPRLPHAKLRYKALALVQHMMARKVAERADRVFVSTFASIAWVEQFVQSQAQIGWLPVPSNLPTVVPKKASDALRRTLGPPGSFLIGHFGTYGSDIQCWLRQSIPQLLEWGRDRRCLLLGRGAVSVRNSLVKARPHFGPRIQGYEGLHDAELALHIAACDAMIQPFPDGVSGRRTSLMAGLALGVPTVTTSGHSTEQIWTESGAVELCPVNSPDDFSRVADSLFNTPARLHEMSLRGASLYQNRFAIQHTIAALREVSRKRAGV